MVCRKMALGHRSVPGNPSGPGSAAEADRRNVGGAIIPSVCRGRPLQFSGMVYSVASGAGP